MSTTQFGKEGWTPARLGNLAGKTFLITGANAGAGFEASKILLTKGATVVMLNRSDSKSEKAIADLHGELGADAKVSYVRTDLADLASVRSAAKKILASVPVIDALICNAAIAQTATQTFTKEGFESQLGVNHYGHFLLQSLLFDRIEEAKGRIVVVASEGYKMGLKTINFDDLNFNEGYEANTVYSQSKLAQMMTAFELQRRIEKAGKQTKVYICHPGASKTSLIRDDAPLMTRLTWAVMSRLPIVQSATKGAYPEVMCATEPNLKQKAFYGPTGFMQWSGPVGECKMEDHPLDEVIAERLWTVSEQAVGGKFAV